MKYTLPTSVEEATAALAANSSAKVFAGATDVVPQMRSGRINPEVLIDLKGIAELSSVSSDATKWTIGAAVPTARLTEDPVFSAEFAGLSEAAGLIGSDQIQSRSSLGGNLCNGSPAADSVPAMVVNSARAVIAGPAGRRTIDVADVVTGPGSTSLAEGELLVAIEVDHKPANTGEAYLRITPRTEMDIAVVGVGVRVTLDDSGTCTAATIALGAVAPTVVRVPDAEAALVGSKLDDAALAACAAAASAACNPIDDMRGTIAYRTQVAGVLAKRAVLVAAKRASGN